MSWLTPWRPGSKRRPSRTHWLGRRPDDITHVLIAGETGSGKTILFMKLVELMVQTGGCFLPLAKSSDRPAVERILAEAGRDAIWLDANSDWAVNPLAGVLPGADPATRAVEVASLTMEMARASGGVQAGSDDEGGFWSFGQMAVLRNAAGLVLSVLPTCTFELLGQVIDTAPQSVADLDSPRYRAGLNGRLCVKALANGGERFVRYWQSVYAPMADRTRSGFAAMPQGALDLMSVGVAGKLFGGKGRQLDLDRVVAEGAVVVADFPPGRYEQGRPIYAGLKRAFLNPCLNRRVTADSPKFWFGFDEFPQCAAESDARMLETIRSAHCSVAAVIQGRESLTRQWPGPAGEAVADAIIGNLPLKVFTRPTPSTCVWLGQSVLGSELGVTVSGGTTGAEPQGFADYWQGSPKSNSASYSQQMLPLFTPSDFARMRTGSDRDGKVVDLLAVPGRRGQPFEKLSIHRDS